MCYFKTASLIAALFFLGACRAPASGSSIVKSQGPGRILEVPVFEDSAETIYASEKEILQKTQQALDRLKAGTPTQNFKATFGELDRINSELSKVWSRIYLLMDASPEEEVRKAAAESVVRMEHFYIDQVDLNEDLYKQLKAISLQLKDKALSAEEQRYVAKVIRAYELEGMALNVADRAILQSYQERLSELTTTISNNINNALGDVQLKKSELEGLTDEQLAALSYDAATDLYTVRSSNSTTYGIVMRKASQSETRRKVLRARYQRAMDENGPLIVEVLQLRLKIAQLLGYPGWADYRLEDRMARNGTTALNFLQKLDQSLTDKFKREQDELLQMKREDLSVPDQVPVSMPLEDVNYYTDLLVQARYTVDTEALRVYFPEQEVVPGMISAVGEVLGFTFQEKPAPHAWVDDLRYFELYDKASGKLMGAFYLDLHPRPGKYTHFATYSLIDGRLREDGTYQAPLSVIVGNFPTATSQQPSLWSYDELGTFIHEFGHVLHAVLTEAHLSAFAGTSVPRDYVEVASQVLERWLEDPTVLNNFARHYKTGEVFPEETLHRILAAKRATVGHSYQRQLSFGLADLHMHMIEDATGLPQTPAQLYELTNQDFSRYYPVDSDTGFLASFEHLFGGYDAGYYSYAWADVISADIAGTFRASTQGFHDQQLGARLRESIYATGYTRDPDVSIRDFLGRDFSDDAFLAELSLAPEF